MEENRVDFLLSLVELNKIKLDTLNKMAYYEYKNLKDSKDYIDLIELYKITCSVINNKLKKKTYEEKIELRNDLLRLNNSVGEEINFVLLLDYVEDKDLVLKRTLVDLNTDILRLYHDTEEKSVQNISFVLELLGFNVIDDNPKKINADLVNSCMVSDFTNVLLMQIEKYSELTSDTEEYYYQLSSMKNHLIFLTPNIENRMLITNFAVPNEPLLSDKLTIETTNLTVDEYLKKFDIVMINWLEKLLNYCFYKVLEKNKKISLSDAVFIETLSNCINDKECLSYLLTELTEKDNNSNENTFDFIRKIILNSQVENIVGEDKRRYKKI